MRYGNTSAVFLHTVPPAYHGPNAIGPSAKQRKPRHTKKSPVTSPEKHGPEAREGEGLLDFLRAERQDRVKPCSLSLLIGIIFPPTVKPGMRRRPKPDVAVLIADLASVLDLGLTLPVIRIPGEGGRSDT